MQPSHGTSPAPAGSGGWVGLLTPARLTRFGIAVAVALTVAFVVFVATADGVQAIAGGRLGGDWAAFHTAGVLLLDDPGLLLDPVAQQDQMARYLDGNFAPFPYPPLFGYLYVPFALVGFRVGYVVYVLCLLALGIVAVRWILDLSGVSSDWRLVGLLGAMTYPGTFLSVGGAQNATITLFLLALTGRLLADDRPVAAGLALGLLWFKPQFAIPVLALVLVAGHRRTVAVASAVGLAIAGVTGLVFGGDWLARWYDLLRLTDTGNRIFNTGATVSPVEWVRGVVASPAGDLVGLALAVGLGLGFAVVAHRRNRPRDLLPIIVLALLLTAPHALLYELCLLVPVLAVVVRHRGPAWGLGLWAAAGVLAFSVPAPLRIGYVVVVGVLWWSTLPPDWRGPPVAVAGDDPTVALRGTDHTGNTIVDRTPRDASGGREHA